MAKPKPRLKRFSETNSLPTPGPHSLEPESSTPKKKGRLTPPRNRPITPSASPIVSAAPAAPDSSPPEGLKLRVRKGAARKISVVRKKKTFPGEELQTGVSTTPQTEKLVSGPSLAHPAQHELYRVLFVTSECTPLAQTGGLGDAVAGLSKALAHRGHQVRLVMPLYRSIDRSRFDLRFLQPCCVHFGKGEEIWVGIWEGLLDGQVPIWFVEYERYFGRLGNLYDEPEDLDNGYRFGLLSKAALQITKDLNFIPHVMHAHDWMSAMACVFLKTWDRVLSPLSETASLLTIHNLGYQGKFPADVMSFYGLGSEHYHPDAFEDFGSVNLLKAGIQYSDALTTVSPTYAKEILTPLGGQGLAPYLNNRRYDLFGILNGVDGTVWNPATDRLLPATYSATDLEGKAHCKRVIQERFGLEVDPRLPLFAIISRFAPQKGFDLIRGSLPQALRDMNIQVVALGSGEPLTENFFRWLAGAFPGRANVHIGFAGELAHVIEAGADFFIMPSIYEPCGLNQMYSSLFGTLPIVRATGGLEDTVDNYDEASGQGTGFKFWASDDRALYYTLGWANATWWDRPEHIAALRKRGMEKDFSWDTSALHYEGAYRHAMTNRQALR